MKNALIFCASLLLIAGCTTAHFPWPSRPVTMPPPFPPPAKAIVRPAAYLAATATDTGGYESDFSNEAVLALGTNRANLVTLAWDKSPGTNKIANYKVYRGAASRSYTTNFSAGTNLTLTVPIYPPSPTNLVVVVTSVNATNLQWATALGKSWSLLGATNYTATNPPMRVWRGLGRSKANPPRLTVKASVQ